MSQRAKTWSVAAAAAGTVLAGAIFGGGQGSIDQGWIALTVLWAGSLSLSLTGSWLLERYKRTRTRPFRILGHGAILAAAGATLLLASTVRWFDTRVGEVFGGGLLGSTWAAAVLVNVRSFIKGPDAPPPLRWRDLTAPRPQR